MKRADIIIGRKYLYRQTHHTKYSPNTRYEAIMEVTDIGKVSGLIRGTPVVVFVNDYDWASRGLSLGLEFFVEEAPIETHPQYYL